MKTSLDIWPPFPIAIICLPIRDVDKEDEENIIAALAHRDRISFLEIYDSVGISLKKWVIAMQEPLPALVNLFLGTFYEGYPVVLPNAFLGGYAPRLRSFILQRVAFPAFPKFVLHATQIVFLSLIDIPDSWYTFVSPKAMATCLAALPDLESLCIMFRSPPSSPLQPSPPPRMRSVLPALTSVRFKGVSEYLEGVIARIDAPHLDVLHMVFFMDLIFNIPQLHRFIGRMGSPIPLNPAQLQFSGDAVRISFGSLSTSLWFEIKCEEPDWQLSSVTHLCNDHFSLLSQVEQLDICVTPSMELAGKNEVDSSQWLELFRLFGAVRRLYVSKKLEPLVTAALGELTRERTMEVLPALETLSLDELEPSGSAHDNMESFIAARRLLDHSIVALREERQSLPNTDFASIFG